MLDYHCHTTTRDGKHSIEENIQHAIKKGFSEIGISEHWGMFPDDWENYYGDKKYFGIEFEELKIKKTAPYSMRGSLLKYFWTIRDLKAKYKDQIIVKAGLEMDLYDSNLEESAKLVWSYEPDYIIGAIHALNKIGYHSFESLDNVTREDYKRNLKAQIGFAKRGGFNILGHGNDYKTFTDFGDESQFYDLYEELIVACKENNIIPEYNTSCLIYNYRIDPNLFFLKKCAELDVPIILTSDAHNKYTIGDKFDFAFTLLHQAGVKLTAEFTKGKANIHEIDYEKAFKWCPYFPLEKPWVI